MPKPRYGKPRWALGSTRAMPVIPPPSAKSTDEGDESKGGTDGAGSGDKAEHPLAKLGDAYLDASSIVEWSEVSGVEPWVGGFHMDKAAAESLEVGSKTSLQIKGRGKELKVEGLFVIGRGPAAAPHFGAVLVADRRIWWKRIHVFRRYNVRARTGTRRWIDPDGSTPEEIEVAVDDVFYKAFSLQDQKTRWNAKDILEDILNEVVGEDAWEWAGESSSIAERYVDNFEIDDSADVAIGKALALVPGYDIKVGQDGRVYLYPRFDLESSDQLMKSMGPPIAGSALAVKTDFTNMRPKVINVLFQIEQEMRFDSIESGDTIEEDQRYMECVVPVPEYELAVFDEDGDELRTVANGTYLRLAEILRSWNKDKGENVEVDDISEQGIREGWLVDFMEHKWGQVGKLNPFVIWMKRIAALRQHYRQTYRISRRWMQRFHSIRPYRVSLIDTETGQFARSLVYQDFSVYYNHRGLLGQASADMKHVIWNVDGGVEAQEKLENGEASPALVRIVDPEQGILHIDLQHDYLGHFHQIIPSKIENVGSIDPDDWNERAYFHDGTIGGEGEPFNVSLAEEHRVSVVLTVAPGSPNSRANLWKVPIDYQKARESYVAKWLGGGGAYGRAWDIKVGPQLATARFAWSHEDADTIAMAMGANLQNELQAVAARQDLEHLLQNEKELTELAESLAVSLYATLQDRYVGASIHDFNPDAKVTGNVARVIHRLMPTGQLLTVLQMPEQMQQPDALALLPASARRLFLKEVQP